MNNIIQIRLCIFDYECPHDEISKLLDIKPFKVWTKGQPRGGITGAKPYEQNCWILDSGLDKHKSFEEHLEALLNKIKPNLDKFIPICNQYYTSLYCQIMFTANNEVSTPSAEITSEQLKILASLNVNIDNDFYRIP